MANKAANVQAVQTEAQTSQHPFSVRPSDHGLGAFADKRIKRGTRILVDKPIMNLPWGNLHQSFQFAEIYSKYNSLSAEDREDFDALSHNEDGIIREDEPKLLRALAAAKEVTTASGTRLTISQEGTTAEDTANTELQLIRRIVFVFHTNNVVMRLSDGSKAFGIFPTYSRFNHSCTPNATFIYDMPTASMFVHTLRDINVDEEIKIHYFATFFPHAARQELIYDKMWGFKCTCPACEDGPLKEEHDNNRTRLQELHLIFEDDDLKENIYQEDWAKLLEAAQEFISLMKKEGLGGSYLTVWYMRCSRYSYEIGLDTMTLSPFKEAVQYARLALENSKYFEGTMNWEVPWAILQQRQQELEIATVEMKKLEEQSECSFQKNEPLQPIVKTSEAKKLEERVERSVQKIEPAPPTAKPTTKSKTCALFGTEVKRGKILAAFG